MPNLVSVGQIAWASVWGPNINLGDAGPPKTCPTEATSVTTANLVVLGQTAGA